MTFPLTLKTNHILADANFATQFTGIAGTVSGDVFGANTDWTVDFFQTLQGFPGWLQPAGVTNQTFPIWRIRGPLPASGAGGPWDGGGISTSAVNGSIQVNAIATGRTLWLQTPGLTNDGGGGRVTCESNPTTGVVEARMYTDAGFAGDNRAYVMSRSLEAFNTTTASSATWSMGGAQSNTIWTMRNIGSTLSDSAGIVTRSQATSSDGQMSCRLGGTGNATYQNTVHFHYDASDSSRGNYAGNFSINQNNWVIQSSSDYRLKTNVETMMDGLDTLRRLRPRRFNWVVDPNGESVVGFIAREYQEVLPDAVALPPDSVDRDGFPQYQTLDPASSIPTLIAAIIQLKAQVDELDAELGLEQKSWL